MNWINKIISNIFPGNGLHTGNDVERFFLNITITGRYIYGYLCLRKAIASYGRAPFPEDIDILLQGYSYTRNVQFWEEVVLAFSPLGIEEEGCDEKVLKNYGYSYEFYEEVKYYYESEHKVISNLLEELIWLARANLYTGYTSETTMPSLETIVQIMRDNQIDLPAFEKVGDLVIVGDDPWGKSTRMEYYL